MLNVLCLAHDFKGPDLIKEARRQGCRTALLTRDRFRHAEWPWESIDELLTAEDLDLATPQVCELMRRWRIDRVFPLQERDVERAAGLRELLGLPGMLRAQARHFRDKLAMRELTEKAGLPNPPFVHVLHHPTVERYARTVKPPWMLKPRSEAGSFGIHRIESADSLWSAVDALGDESSFYLLEQCVSGEVYHVDSIVAAGRVVFAQAHRYGRSPFEVWNHGGVFSTFSLQPGDRVAKELAELNERVLAALGLRSGVAHVEFVGKPGKLRFLEAAARVGGANIDVLVEKSSGVNLWTEWLKLELHGELYRPPSRRHHAAALLQCLSRQEQPDLRHLQGPDTVWTLSMPRHAGVIIASPSPEVVRRQAELAMGRLEREHLAIVAPIKTRR